jgi:protein-tyrosine phosphatase
MIHRIVVLCTGNICRSPMAEGLLKAELPELTVFSAGVGAVVGAPAEPHAIEVMAEHGHDIRAHRAQQLTQPMLQAVDLALVLDQTHADWIYRRYPQFRGKVHKLLKWQDDADVPDPYRAPRAVFESAYTMIETGIGLWLPRLARR